MPANPPVKYVLEAALMAAEGTLDLDQMQGLFDPALAPDRQTLRQALAELRQDYEGRGLEVKQVASGWRIQVREAYAPWVSRLWEEKPGRYSRALLETLAIIAYRQPVTRGEIEDIRGVTVSSSIMRTLTDRGWVRIVGHKDVPGRPGLYATTPAFLDYFNLSSLSELPDLTSLNDPDNPEMELPLPDPDDPDAP
ncbi:SMC-Scp complex subunit ScpB [Alkalilimnicola ehrlichii]|uniref:Condensin subunit ScpB n=2 Tax=Alkalilimnicola ehrlichii TaxID=351052 RepID=Q0AAR1_ALKEH|nr:SMC-Scp complex subunit ScpB [Alkalilimnicola ehrlichii]ABI56076.1 condensin subunit ScpB [Alkalilimnicola ehrlichii MLHE-1]